MRMNLGIERDVSVSVIAHLAWGNQQTSTRLEMMKTTSGIAVVMVVLKLETAASGTKRELGQRLALDLTKRTVSACGFRILQEIFVTTESCWTRDETR